MKDYAGIAQISRRSLLSVAAAAAVSAQPVQDDWQGVGRIVAVGDIHGDKDAFVAVLRMAGLIDDSEKWAGGQTHLVQIGDIPARAPQSRQAYDLLMRLEPEAAAAGGKVHPIIGNHDAGLMYGDLRSVLPEEYAEFREPGSEERLEKFYADEVAALRKTGQLATAEAAANHRKDWMEMHAPGFVEHRAAFSANGKYGSWIRRNNSLVRINRTLFLHGGISPKYVRVPRTDINNTIRRELLDPSKLPPGVTTDTQGPLWYRGLAEENEVKLELHLRAVLRFHGVDRIVIGHTVTRTAILPRFGGRVVNIDLGLSRFFGRPPACLVLDGTASYVLHAGVKIPLPGPGPGEREKYLRKVVAADKPPSPVEKLLTESEK